ITFFDHLQISIDRIVYRKVRDFLCITLFGKDIFGSFNVADASLCIGVVLFAVYILFYFDKDSKALEKMKKAAAQAENQPVAQTVGDGAVLEENHEENTTNSDETVNKTENAEVVEVNKTDGNNETDA
ncbi:MAG: signal peptidase II, partial [Candidatus Neoclostridium sp.]